MKYVKQFGIILCVSLAGEVLHQFIPLPIPASIYGIVILFLCLEWKIISVSAVKEPSSFLIEIMPVMFIPAAVGLMDSWQIIKNDWVSYAVITIFSTFVVMIVSGKVVQAVINRTQKKREDRQ